MAVYLDTSTVIPLFFNEQASLPTISRIARESDTWLSRWTLAEFSGAASFKIRNRQTSAATAGLALALLRKKLAQGEFCLVELERNDFNEASRLCQTHQCELRTPDALHAAIAMRLRLPLLTCNKGQADGYGYHAIECEFTVTP
jgi:predicted nucleic acid-binding protein